ncbi:MAG: hypothetical protein KatS3mg059_1320 [Thermomicrobiales bacterium]|nr:MAG: hypothetical protein KatS3mg059_1320 [Thermomicrobiales bacterium]
MSTLPAACDGHDQQDDGIITLHNVPAGRYVLIESTVPPRYLGADTVRVRLSAGETADITVQNVPIPGTLVIHKVDHRNQPLAGACFGVYVDTGNGGLGRRLARTCDDADGTADGMTTFSSVPAGSVVVVEERAPRGYEGAAATTVVIPSGGEIAITIQNQPRQPEPSPTPEGQEAGVAPSPATPTDSPASSDATPGASESPTETPEAEQDEPSAEPTAIVVSVRPATPES